MSGKAIYQEESEKQIKSRLNKMLAKQNARRAETEELALSIERQQARLKAVEEKEGLLVTEHAILRYLERVKGVDMVDLRGEMISEEVREQIGQLRSGKFPMPTHNLIVKNARVISVTVNH